MVTSQVYNHVFAAGQYNQYSVLDKIVPGYYIRRSEDGDVEVSYRKHIVYI